MTTSHNPYAAPVKTAAISRHVGGGVGAEASMATRGARFWARLLDGALGVFVVLPGFIWATAAVVRELSSSRAKLPAAGPLDVTGFTAWQILVALPGLVLAGYQWFLVARDGQTIGKKWMSIRIVRMNGAPVGFFRGVVLREWLGAVAPLVHPLLGFFVLVDSLWIFATASRCVHDYIADTRVVSVVAARQTQKQARKKRRAKRTNTISHDEPRVDAESSDEEVLSKKEES